MYKPFGGRSLWTGADLEADQSLRWPWAKGVLAEIDAALSVAKTDSVGWLATTRDTFPLQAVAAKLAHAAEELKTVAALSCWKACP